MMSRVKVLKVGYSKLNNCVIIKYEGEAGNQPYAAVAERLSLKEGDTVWILRNEKLNYKGFGAVAVLLA